jgi:environmental stress-induced protein Ves
MPSLRHLRPDAYRVMPWKNGLGVTTEIAVHPPGAGLDAFTWRLSIADLQASGPFSTFAGYDRILVQIEGAPMILSHAGRGERRLSLLSPYRFAGELDTFGALETPARDFNVMVRREQASAEVSVLDLAPDAPLRIDGKVETRIVYELRGAVSVQADGEPCALTANETLIAMDAARLVLTAAEESAVAFVVTIGAPGRFAALT